jgi:N-acetylmuramoyl-L-alanine amidase
VDALAISLKLRDVLVAQGVKVVMVRTGNNVDIPNSARARIGNRAKADLFVSIHLNGATSSSARGIMTLYPQSKWTGAIGVRSKAAAGSVESAVTKATGWPAWPLSARGDLTEFNFSTRPIILVECGFLSNPAEDRQAATSAFQAKIARGIGAGVMSYLKSR